MKIVITTQIQENYGAHDWNGEGTCPSYWKMKGGNTYVLLGVEIGEDFTALTEKLETLIETDNEGWQEYLIGCDLLDDDVKCGCAEWEEPIAINRLGDQFFAVEKSSMNPDYFKTSTLLAGGKRADYSTNQDAATGKLVKWPQAEMIVEQARGTKPFVRAAVINPDDIPVEAYDHITPESLGY